ncbi:RHS repeat-associated core domain-containing protein [archaeon]|nr:RHS repeat-associated core domain-containing protein [archaeon]
MKKEVLLILLVVLMPIGLAKEVDIPKTYDVDKDSDEISQGVTTYFYAGSKLLATKENDEITYHYQDRLGSNIESKSLPFGQEIVSGERFSFTGKELDSSELYHFGARDYDSDLGKFTSVDKIPSEPAYQYVGNNPIMMVDPSGMEDISVYWARLFSSQFSGNGMNSAWGIGGSLSEGKSFFGLGGKVLVGNTVGGSNLFAEVVHPFKTDFFGELSRELGSGFSLNFFHSSEHDIPFGQMDYGNGFVDFPEGGYRDVYVVDRLFYDDDGNVIGNSLRHEFDFIATKFASQINSLGLEFSGGDSNYYLGLADVLNPSYLSINTFLRGIGGPPVLVGGDCYGGKSAFGILGIYSKQFQGGTSITGGYLTDFGEKDGFGAINMRKIFDYKVSDSANPFIDIFGSTEGNGGIGAGLTF